MLLHAGGKKGQLAIDPDAADARGWTALARAAYSGHVECVDELLLRSARVNLANDDGLTPLHIAALRNNTSIVARLLRSEVEADVNARDARCWTPLMIAANLGHEPVVSQLVANPLCAVHLTDERGCSALWLASRQGHPGVAARILGAFCG